MSWGASDFGSVEAGRLIWGAPEWFWPALLVAFLISALVLWSYYRGRFVGAAGVLAGVFKIAAIGLIAFCLLEPLMSGTRPRPQANVMPILVDNSRSMQLKPEPGGESRGSRAVGLVEARTPARTRLEQDFDVRDYRFDARLEAIDSFGAMDFKGGSSALLASLRLLAERFSGRPVGGVLLFTDGNATDVADDAFDWGAFGFPVYPVVASDPEEIRDLRVSELSVRETDFESAPITVSASVESIGLGSSAAKVRLTDLTTDRVIETRTLQVVADGQPVSARFRFRPERPGVGFYRVTTFLEGDAKAKSGEDSGNEVTLANNSALAVVDRSTGPYRVLYVAGRPNWEFKFIRRALQEDAEIELVGLLRIAKEEPKFSFRDRGVDSTNPLFAGLGEDEEETAEKYDEPVIVRLGVKDSDELSQGFPRSAEELFSYHGLILDDIEPEFFTQDEMLLIRRFVAARGGGLMMLGGEGLFSERGFGDTPLGELAPVYSPRRTSANPAGRYRMDLTREGMLQPWIRLRETETEERERLRQMPPFTTVSPFGQIKPGASMLASVTREGDDEFPAVVAQRFGKGRTAAIAIADMWRWSMRRGEGERDDPAQAWRQFTHWLVGDVPRRAEVRVQPGEDPSQPVKIVATARDEAYLPLDNAKVTLKVTPIGGEPLELTASPEGDEPGIYTASYWSNDTDGYRVEADIRAPDGSQVGTADSGWASDPAASEFRDLTTNRQLLESIARETGGEVIAESDLESFAAELPNRKLPVTETWVYPIWHRSWIMIAAVLCLCGEWGLRRWKGLP